jgi:hypothetical protein
MPRFSRHNLRRNANGTTGAAARDLFAKSDPKIKREADIAILDGLLHRIFLNAVRKIGAEKTRQRFARYAKPPPKLALKLMLREDEFQIWENLGRPSPTAFARQLADRGLGTFDAIYDQIKPNRRAKRKNLKRR